MAAVAWPYILLRKTLGNCDSVLKDRYAALNAKPGHSRYAGRRTAARYTMSNALESAMCRKLEFDASHPQASLRSYPRTLEAGHRSHARRTIASGSIGREVR